MNGWSWVFEGIREYAEPFHETSGESFDPEPEMRFAGVGVGQVAPDSFPCHVDQTPESDPTTLRRIPP